MSNLPIFALAIVGAIFSMFLLEQQKSYGVLIAIAVGMLVFFYSIARLSIVFQAIEEFQKKTHVSDFYFGIMLKMTGIAIVSDLTAELCSQSGSGLIAKQVRIFGRICILLAGLPILEQLMELIEGLL